MNTWDADAQTNAVVENASIEIATQAWRVEIPLHDQDGKFLAKSLSQRDKKSILWGAVPYTTSSVHVRQVKAGMGVFVKCTSEAHEFEVRKTFTELCSLIVAMVLAFMASVFHSTVDSLSKLFATLLADMVDRKQSLTFIDVFHTTSSARFAPFSHVLAALLSKP